MGESKAKWDEVSERFTDLGKRVKDRYDANAAFGDEERAKVDNALHQLTESLDASFTAFGDSLRDTDMRADFKQAGIAFGDAIAATFSDLADEIRKAVRR